MPYALIKKNKPEAFDLGKGSRTGGWVTVFGRYYGKPFDDRDGNFLESIPRPLIEDLHKTIHADNGYSGPPPDIITARIRDWIGEDEVFLINYWEEIVWMIEEGSGEDDFKNEFDGIYPLLSHPLSQYSETGNIWK